MSIVWLVPEGVLSSLAPAAPEASLLTHRVASVRLRAGVAASEWKRSGGENVFIDPAAGALAWGRVDACIVPKFYFDSPLAPWLDACRAMKDQGLPLVLDVCDYPFAKPAPVPQFYAAALGLADRVIVNSQRMAQLLYDQPGPWPAIIEDAILDAPGEPRFAPGRRLELLWFGHPSNLGYLHALCASLAEFAREHPLRLTVVTTYSPDLARSLAPLNVRVIHWSLQTQRDALRKTDLVVLPSDAADPLKAGASVNRLAEALNAGRFPVASPLASYLPFSECAWLGDDLIEGIRWALENPEEVLIRIRRGQALVAERLSTQVIGAQWQGLFEKLSA